MNRMKKYHLRFQMKLVILAVIVQNGTFPRNLYLRIKLLGRNPSQ